VFLTVVSAFIYSPAYGMHALRLLYPINNCWREVANPGLMQP